MAETAFHVGNIDHVELFVPDQYAAASWYEQVFGMQIIKGFEDWAAIGPLMISSDGGTTKLALFKGDPPGERAVIGYRRVAFHADGAAFLTFLRRLSEVEIFDRDGSRLMPEDVVDHGKAYSIYFNDPYGHPYEVTTYDYDQVTAGLETL